MLPSNQKIIMQEVCRCLKYGKGPLRLPEIDIKSLTLISKSLIFFFNIFHIRLVFSNPCSLRCIETFIQYRISIMIFQDQLIKKVQFALPTH